MLLPKDEWEKTAQKSKLPKPKLDKDVLTIAVDVLEKRLKEYPTTLEVRTVLCAVFSLAMLNIIRRTRRSSHQNASGNSR